MAMNFDCGTFQMRSGTGTQNVAVSLNSTTPQFILFSTADVANLTNSMRSGMSHSVGFATGTGSSDNVGFGSANVDNVAQPGACGNWSIQGKSIIVVDPTNSTTVAQTPSQASVSAWTTDQFTVNWTTNNGELTYVHYWVFSGLDNAGIDFIRSPSSSNGDVAYTGLGFTPDIIFSLAALNATAWSGGTDYLNKAGGGFGWSTIDDDYCQNHAVLASTTNQTCRLQQPYLISFGWPNGVTPTQLDRAVVKSADASGCTLTWSDTDANQWRGAIIGLKGPFLKKAGREAAPSATGSQPITTGFKPKTVIFANMSHSGDLTEYVSQSIGWQVAIGTTGYGTSALVEDQQNPTDCWMYSMRNSKPLYIWSPVNAGVWLSGNINAYNSDNFNIIWVHTLGGGQKFIYLALSDTEYLTPASMPSAVGSTTKGSILETITPSPASSVASAQGDVDDIRELELTYAITNVPFDPDTQLEVGTIVTPASAASAVGATTAPTLEYNDEVIPTPASAYATATFNDYLDDLTPASAVGASSGPTSVVITVTPGSASAVAATTAPDIDEDFNITPSAATSVASTTGPTVQYTVNQDAPSDSGSTAPSQEVGLTPGATASAITGTAGNTAEDVYPGSASARGTTSGPTAEIEDNVYPAAAGSRASTAGPTSDELVSPGVASVIGATSGPGPYLEVSPGAATAVASSTKPAILEVVTEVASAVTSTDHTSILTLVQPAASAVTGTAGPTLSEDDGVTPSPAQAIASSTKPEIVEVYVPGTFADQIPSAVAAASGGTVLVEVYPSAVTARATTSGPTIETTDNVYPSPASAVTGTDGGVAEDVYPGSASAVASATDPFVTAQYEPSPATAVASATDPLLVYAQVMDTPASAVTSVAGPTLSADDGVTPSAATSVAATADPVLVDEVNQENETTGSATDPTVSYADNETPSAVTAVAGTTDPELLDEIGGIASAVTGTDHTVLQVVTPAPASAVASTAHTVQEDIEGRSATAVTSTTDPTVEVAEVVEPSAASAVAATSGLSILEIVTETASAVTSVAGPTIDEIDRVTPSPADVIAASAGPTVDEDAYPGNVTAVTSTSGPEVHIEPPTTAASAVTGTTDPIVIRTITGDAPTQGETQDPSLEYEVDTNPASAVTGIDQGSILEEFVGQAQAVAATSRGATQDDITPGAATAVAGTTAPDAVITTEATAAASAVTGTTVGDVLDSVTPPPASAVTSTTDPTLQSTDGITPTPASAVAASTKPTIDEIVTPVSASAVAASSEPDVHIEPPTIPASAVVATSSGERAEVITKITSAIAASTKPTILYVSETSDSATAVTATSRGGAQEDIDTTPASAVTSTERTVQEDIDGIIVSAVTSTSLPVPPSIEPSTTPASAVVATSELTISEIVTPSPASAVTGIGNPVIEHGDHVHAAPVTAVGATSGGDIDEIVTPPAASAVTGVDLAAREFSPVSITPASAVTGVDSSIAWIVTDVVSAVTATSGPTLDYGTIGHSTVAVIGATSGPTIKEEFVGTISTVGATSRGAIQEDVYPGIASAVTQASAYHPVFIEPSLVPADAVGTSTKPVIDEVVTPGAATAVTGTTLGTVDHGDHVHPVGVSTIGATSGPTIDEIVTKVADAVAATTLNVVEIATEATGAASAVGATTSPGVFIEVTPAPASAVTSVEGPLASTETEVTPPAATAVTQTSRLVIDDIVTPAPASARAATTDPTIGEIVTEIAQAVAATTDPTTAEAIQGTVAAAAIAVTTKPVIDEVVILDPAAVTTSSNEIQTFTASGATGGTFTLDIYISGYDTPFTTAPIAYDADQAAIQAAVDAALATLPGYTNGDVVVTNPGTADADATVLTFSGDSVAAYDHEQVVVDDSGLIGGASAPSTIADGCCLDSFQIGADVEIITPAPASAVGATTEPRIFEAEVGMPVRYDFYGTMGEANEYFTQRLHEHAWSTASPADRQRALIYATRLIDTMNFKGQKASITELLERKGCDEPLHASVQSGCVTIEEIQTASLEQPTEFPRGQDEYVPVNIKIATYEIAHSLLDDKDPEAELENLQITSHGYASVRVSYNRSYNPMEHLMNMIPNPFAWRLIRPFLNDEDAIMLRRVT